MRFGSTYNEQTIYRKYGGHVRNRGLVGLIMFALVLAAGIFWYENRTQEVSQTNDNFIKWVDFNASKEAMKKACLMDIESYEAEKHLDWITLLAYAAVRGGGEFGSRSASYIDEIAAKLTNGETTEEELREKYQYFPYYYEAYSAVLGGMVGEYEIRDESGACQKKYGLKAFSPIAAGFSYQDYDDFGVGRDYYYAHLRQNRPYAEGLKEGDYVTAGDVIGYMGHTGYSDKENVNNIKTVHLHVGLQLIFDESQKDGNNEIWVDFYQLAGFLSGHRCEVERDDLTKEWDRKYDMKDPVVPDKF